MIPDPTERFNEGYQAGVRTTCIAVFVMLLAALVIVIRRLL